MDMTSAEPALYSVDDAGKPTLLGARDTAGNVTFPYQTFGSEHTGDHGPDLTQVGFAGTGTVLATTKVFGHPAQDRDSAFTVASIVLDEGPMIRGVLSAGTAAHIGDKVRAITCPVTRDGTEVAELRFALAASQEKP
ncbi:hypothetical protein K7711_43505 [Nocardia sp. CA2R105]|uniref:Zn-ribbon domain-containing OB-fold protein n=1 Tax=Nocardia coffeae TaxID=2873381 RepID=UPI001CA64BFD|nr:hypothetical protein [Nocardia coffeae]MBY8863398.1 hypothetical protein [Nocardia coffeae]